MPVTTYETVNGEILGEIRGGVERDYVPDPLGSTAALIDSSQSKTDTFSYWPYGEERSHTGTSVTPFRFVGTLGYYRDDSARTYVRARHLSTKNARWLTVDPLWPDESAYGYVHGSTTTMTDPFGLQVVIKPPHSILPLCNLGQVLGWHLACVALSTPPYVYCWYSSCKQVGGAGAYVCLCTCWYDPAHFSPYLA